jgi:hypothetical protein
MSTRALASASGPLLPNPGTPTESESPQLRISDSDSALTLLERALVNALISAIVKELQSKGLHPTHPPTV